MTGAGKLRVRPDVKAFREEAFRAVEALSQRYYTIEAHEGCIKDFARHIVDMADYIGILEGVAHAAWHLLDDSGEVPDEPDVHQHMASDSERLSSCLDALEANGWEAHDDG